MKLEDITTMYQEIGYIQGIALSVKDDGLADGLFTATEIMIEIVEKLMQEVIGNET